MAGPAPAGLCPPKGAPSSLLPKEGAQYGFSELARGQLGGWGVTLGSIWDRTEWNDEKSPN